METSLPLGRVIVGAIVIAVAAVIGIALVAFPVNTVGAVAAAEIAFRNGQRRIIHVFVLHN